MTRRLSHPTGARVHENPAGGIGQITPNKPAMLVSIIVALLWIGLAGILPVPSDDLLNLLVMVALGLLFLATQCLRT